MEDHTPGESMAKRVFGSVGGGDRPSEGGLLSPAQLAALLRMSRRQVLRLGIRRVKLGWRTVRYRKEDVDEFIKAKAQEEY